MTTRDEILRQINNSALGGLIEAEDAADITLAEIRRAVREELEELRAWTGFAQGHPMNHPDEWDRGWNERGDATRTEIDRRLAALGAQDGTKESK